VKEAKPLNSSRVFRLWLLLWALPGLCLAQVSKPTQTETNKKFERLARWLKSPDESVRVDAIQELTSGHDPAAIPLILQCLQDTNVSVRGAAAWGLLLSRGPQVVSALRPVLNDEDDRVRAAAVWSLSHAGGRAVLPDVIRLATNDASGVVRFRAVWGLAFCGDKSTLPIIVNALGDYNNAVRERSALLALDALATNP
jgi:HEAT repeat protein